MPRSMLQKPHASCSPRNTFLSNPEALHTCVASMSLDPMTLGIVVLNWNGKEITPRCLYSIFNGSSLPDAVIVVDNASVDGSAEIIRGQYPQVTLIENSSNLGFAEGCNIGIRYLLDRDFDFILLLNNDAEIDFDCLKEFRRAVESYPAAAYAATIYDHEDRSKVWYGGGSISRLTLEARHQTQIPKNADSPRPTEFITGCCLLFRSKALRKTGLLDTNFFAYYEDVDWCLRAAASGQQLLLVPNAKVFHEASYSFRRAGSGNNKVSRLSWAQKRPIVLYLTYRNRLLMARKHARGPFHFVFLMVRVALRGTAHAAALALVGKTDKACAVVHGVSDGVFDAAGPPKLSHYF
jgi:GT2 family glycosyltransferase